MRLDWLRCRTHAFTHSRGGNPSRRCLNRTFTFAFFPGPTDPRCVCRRQQTTNALKKMRSSPLLFIAVSSFSLAAPTSFGFAPASIRRAYTADNLAFARRRGDPSKSKLSKLTSLGAEETDSGSMYQATTLIGKTASTLVSGAFFVLLAQKRDAVILTLWIGAIINSILSKVCKKALNHERPAALQESDRIKLKPSDGGMPSSHAMSLSFIGFSITAGVIPEQYQIVAGSCMAIYSFIALRYRIREHLHTIEQVVVGLTLGFINAHIWLRYAMGDTGPVLAWVKGNCVNQSTGLFSCQALSFPVIVGIIVVGSFERRIASWLKERKPK